MTGVGVVSVCRLLKDLQVLAGYQRFHGDGRSPEDHILEKSNERVKRMAGEESEGPLCNKKVLECGYACGRLLSEVKKLAPKDTRRDTALGGLKRSYHPKPP